jgi:hypothetical protein
MTPPNPLSRRPWQDAALDCFTKAPARFWACSGSTMLTTKNRAFNERR